MGSHTRPQGRHRGAAAPLIDVGDVGALAGRAGTALTVAGTAATLVVGVSTLASAGTANRTTVATVAGPAPAATAADFAALRMCESSDHYTDDTGNGYYGAYQFNLDTWDGLGLTGLPSQASPAVQDAAAARLEGYRGWEPWPACSARLGLGDTAVSRSTTARALITTSVVEPAVAVRAVAVVMTPPAFSGTVLTAALVDQRRADVMTWQARMRARGWRIGVDGYFGPQSARIAGEFTAEKGLHSAPPGAVDGPTWDSAWSLPVT